MDNETDKTEHRQLKVIVTYNELDYKGNVKTTELVKEIPFKFNPENFMKYIIKHGSCKGYVKPWGKYFNDLMKEYFGIKQHDKVWRPVKVESEVVENVAKFVFQRNSESSQVMEWEDVK